VQPHLHKLVLLASNLRKLLVDLIHPVTGFLLLRLRSLRQHFDHPITNVVVRDTELLEERQDLLVNGGLFEPVAVVGFRGVLLASVVKVLANAAALQFLGDGFARDRVTAMAAGDKFTAVKKLVGLVAALDPERLDSLPSRGINKMLVRAGPPFALVENLSDVRPILEHPADLAPGEPGLGFRVPDVLLLQPLDNLVNGAAVVGVQLVNPANGAPVFGMDADE